MSKVQKIHKNFFTKMIISKSIAHYCCFNSIEWFMRVVAVKLCGVL